MLHMIFVHVMRVNLSAITTEILDLNKFYFWLSCCWSQWWPGSPVLGKVVYFLSVGPPGLMIMVGNAKSRSCWGPVEVSLGVGGGGVYSVFFVVTWKCFSMLLLGVVPQNPASTDEMSFGSFSLSISFLFLLFLICRKYLYWNCFVFFTWVDTNRL